MPPFYISVGCTKVLIDTRVIDLPNGFMGLRGLGRISYVLPILQLLR
jgi:hypothetical protein